MHKENAMGHIELSKIVPNPVALRQVEKDSQKFQAMVDSVRDYGIMNSITVTKKSNDDGEYYELVDGLHRFTAAQEAGLETIPAMVLEANELEVQIQQVIGNVHKIETKPYQYSHQLKLILSARPEMSLSDLAAMVSQKKEWVAQRLRLVRLDDEIGKLVDENQISLGNAYELSKLPEEEQHNYSADAQTMDPKEFGEKIKARLAEINTAKRKGQKAGPAVFTPVSRCRKVGDIKKEFESGMPTLKALVKDLDGAAAAKATMEWVLSLDAESIAKARADFEEREADRAEKARKRDEERANKLREQADKISK